ncbi:MAG TPA: 6-phosphogluconolactonase [Pseudonocardia sp.]|nr:6-phosphogluconolactonase [Pseudonocardia sp.]
MTAPRPGLRVYRHPDGPVLASAAAARLATRLVDVLAEREVAHLVLTGGTIGIGTLAALAGLPAREAVDWGRVHLWWGDERFVPAGDKDRNETQARDALLDSLPLNPEFVHVMAPSDGPHGDDAEAAAEQYAAELAKYAADGADAPAFDVLLLGMGPDGHIASLFPDHPGTHETTPSAIAVHNSPKPPPNRISLTFRVIQAAREVWVVASGAEKAEAVARALTTTDQVHTPAAGAHGTEATLWLIDEAAAAQL